MDQLNDKSKTLVKILLEFKHLILFLDERFSKELKKILKKLFPEFKLNLELCMEMYKENLYNDNDDDFCQFIKQHENIFGSNDNLFILDRSGTIKQSLTCIKKRNSLRNVSRSIKNDGFNDVLNIKSDPSSNKNEDILDFDKSPVAENIVSDIKLNNDNDKEQKLANFSSNRNSSITDLKSSKGTKSKRKCAFPKKNTSYIVSSDESDVDSVDTDTSESKIFNETKSNKSKRKNVFPKKYAHKIISREEIEEDNVNIDLIEKKIYNESKLNKSKRKNVFPKKSIPNIVSSDEETVNDDTDPNSDLFGIPIEYSCLHENCKFKCHSSTQLKAHEIRNHVKQNVKCLEPGCERVFDTKDELNCHVVKDHGVYQCSNEKCNIAFPNEYKLKMHIKENHKKEYITCKLCDKSYKTRVHLKKHIRVMHVEGEYKCKHENCNFIGKFKKDLTNHKSTRHLLKVCPFPDCGRLVPPNCLKRHLGVHNNVKNYFCSWPDCGKSFNEGKSLKDHVRMHLNFKRFKCKWPDCVYACEQKSNLITHIRVRHFKLPQTKKKQLEMKISLESFPDPFDFIEVCSEDIRI